MEKEKHKVLILKTGYSEILDGKNNSRTVSFGDILRTTCLLNLFKDDNVTWVTDVKAFPLLENNPFIHSLLPYDFTTALQLQAEHFDTIINLEKIPGICALADKINAWRRFGFRFDPKKGEAEAYDKAFDILYVGSDFHAKKENQRYLQEFLFEMVGSKWNGEEYVLGYRPKSQEVFDVGLNTTIGDKWPTKAWPKESWDKIEELLIKNGFKVTRQDKQNPEILANLYSYMDWINSSKLIISTDSLGMHLGMAFKKKVFGLFGPTPDKEIYFYGRGKSITPEEKFECLPCCKGKCNNSEFCMNNITPERVFDEIINFLNSSSTENFIE